MPEQSVLMEKQGPVATLILNRPAVKNSLNAEMLVAMAEHLDALAQNDQIRTVVIRGEGGQAFSSGYDISDIPKYIADKYLEELKGMNPLDIGLAAVERYPYPVIAMIEGYALGAGCELALTCDLRVASADARIGIPASRLGVVYHPQGIQKLVNAIGLANAKEVLYTGRYYRMERAREMGLVHYLVPSEELYGFTYDLAREIADNAPLSLKGHKQIFGKLLHFQGLREQDRPEVDRRISEAFRSQDFRDGSAAFFQKKKPVFQGR